MTERDATLDAFTTPADEGNGDEPEPDETPGPDTDGEPDTTTEPTSEPDAGSTATTARPAEDEPDASGRTDETGVAETTFAWAPEGASCETCADVVNRRWRTDAGFVCGACVDWERAWDRDQ